MANRLSELEREGLVSKKIYPEIPPKVEYRLTFRAEELRIIFKKLGTWASRITTKTKSRAPEKIQISLRLPKDLSFLLQQEAFLDPMSHYVVLH